MALDQFGRQINYLRISITDHCNLRCMYCMPENIRFRPTSELMQDDEILKLVEVFAGLGFYKYRLTGGEPTVRAGVVELVRGIAQTPGVRSLSMTSNGVLFARLADQLAAAGMQRVNFSLDTLDPAKFKHFTRCGEITDVWAGIRAAENAGLLPIKINAVVMRGHNEEDVADLARLTLDHPWQVRFIEMMPFAGATEFQRLQGVTAGEIQARIEAECGSMEPIDAGKLDGEARMFRLPGAQGKIGLITTISEPFCDSCTRARLTADGRLRLCLLREREADLLTPLRMGASHADMRRIIQEAIWLKPLGHRLAQDEVPLNRAMSQIGG